MTIDEELRAIFADRADAAPGKVDLPRVYARSRQLTVRARYRAVFFSTLAVLAILAPIGLLTTARPAPPAGPTAGPATAGPTPSSSPTGSGSVSVVQLVAAVSQPAMPDFPLTVGWRPTGVVFHSGVDADRRALLDDAHGLVIMVSGTQPYNWDWEPASTTTVAVNGVTATARRGVLEGKATTGITWQRPDLGWVTVDSFVGIPYDQVLRLARSLAPGRTAATAPFRFTLLPVGFVMALVTETAVCFTPDRPSYRNRYPGSAAGLCVHVYPADVSPDAIGNFVSIGGVPGQLSSDLAGRTFATRLPDGRLLTVTTIELTQVGNSSTADRVEITTEQLGSFTAGISVAG